jgi:hypothetical protein
VCGEILRARPGHSGTLYVLGIVACQFRQWERGAELLNRAIRANPQDPDAHNDQGITLKALGR